MKGAGTGGALRGPQAGIFTKLQPVFIIFSAFLGILLGKTSACVEQAAGGLIGIFLTAMLFFAFLGVDIKAITKSFTNFKFSVSALVINFVWTPVFSFLLAAVFLPKDAGLRIGFMMLMATPCTDWYLIFTGMANGNVLLGSSILPLNLILQIVLLPVYLLVFMGQTVSIDIEIIGQSIIFVLLIPLVSANAIKAAAKKAKLENYLNGIAGKSDDIQFVLLCFAIISMFASQGSVLPANLNVFIKLLPPLLVFFAVNFFLALFTGKKLQFDFRDIIPLIFTTSARNSPVSLAIAVIAFPSEPVISLALVMGPLIELPVLAVNASVLRRFGRQ
jgi:ACR3 family arsenite efflux pump ArsB